MLDHVAHADRGQQHESPIALVDDRLRLIVVLVADLADDLLDQVLNGNQTGRATVLIHDDRALQLLDL